MRAHLALAALLPAVLARPRPASAEPPPAVVIEAPPARFGLVLNLGASVPTTSTRDPAERGLASFVVDARGVLEVMNVVEVGAAATAALPGRAGADLVASVSLEARIAPFALGLVHPYAGLTFGYAFIEVKQDCIDLGAGCDDKAGPGGVMLGPVAGARFDVSGGRRRVSIYAEIGYEKVFTTPASLDRLVVKAGPGILF